MSARFNAKTAAALAILGLALWPASAEAQLKNHPTPFTIQFDPGALLAERPQTTLPLWLQSVGVQHYKAEPEVPARTVVRLHLRKLNGLAPFLEVRVKLNPGAGQAQLLAWSETGVESFHSASFGSAEAAVSEVFRVPTQAADYLELELPGTGERLGGLYATAMRFTQVLQAVDFAPAPIADSFENAAATTPPSEQDLGLWRRVRALLDPGPFALHPDATEAVDFELLNRPDCAIVSFEMNNAVAEAPPVLQLNEVDLPPASLTLPDLADPAWKGFPIPGTEESRLHYTGWIRVQQFVPGDALLKGINRLELAQSSSGHSSQIRRIEIQLRYPRQAPF